MVSFPCYSHTTPIRIPKDMGIVWEAYHKGVPLLGSLESSLNKRATFFEATKNGMIFDTSGSAEKVLKNPE